MLARVVARFKAAAEGGGYWDEAVKDLNQFNSLFSQVERKPQDATVLKKCVNGTNKLIKLAIWAGKCLTKSVDTTLLTARREIARLAKTKEAPAEELLNAIHQFKKAVQEALDSTAPENFTYQGFKVTNEQHLSDEMCRKALEGVNFLKALFKKRGVQNLIEQGIARIVLVLDAGASAFFHSGTRELTLSVGELSKGNSGRFIDTFVGETVLHEFGHYVHRNYITGEAASAWDAPWEGLPSLANPHALRVPDAKRKEQLDPLEIVTDYGKVDKYEDFAETFMIFMAAPEKLTPTSKFRMQRALSLSGLYGKPVLKFATKDLLASVVERFKAKTMYI
jgi:hypothetical protein